MKPTPRSLCCLLLLMLLAANFAHAQGSPQGTIKHVIIVVQENRTPDNLFYGNGTLWNNGGNVRPPGAVPKGQCRLSPPDDTQVFDIPLTPYQLDACFDTKHRHQDWVATYHNGDMKGACNVGLKTDNCSGGAPPPCQVQLPHNDACPGYTYVGYPTSNDVIGPYYQIANHYGFANYFFQTNQGPSLPAHQFLFSGTSLPIPFSQDQDKSRWFAADNVYKANFGDKVGCIAPSTELVGLIDDDKVWPTSCTPGNPTDHCVYPCLDHKTMLDVFHIPTPHITWRYYAHSNSDLWEAPSAVKDVCQSSGYGGTCQNQEYKDNVVFPDKNPPVEHAKILKDIENCTLKQVSWVIPDGKWSDHPGEVGHNGGPSWVAHIVNAIGNSWEQSKINGQNHQCDYWGGHTTLPSKNQPTVILIVWDDWGGWYDHVAPDFPSGPGIGYSHDSLKSGWYVNGFRVPLLVVSAFNHHVTNGTGGFDGYISGPRDSHVCDGTTNYCHDFGSILNFIEYTFGSGGAYLGSIGDGHSDYADFWAPDAFPTCTQGCPYSLSDFFDFTQSAVAFTPITGMKYAETCFHDPNQTGCWPNAPDADPDDDAGEN